MAAVLLPMCLQGILQGLELHSIYQLTVEFTRALRDAVKQLLIQYKFPEVRAVEPLPFACCHAAWPWVVLCTSSTHFVERIELSYTLYHVPCE